MKNNNRLKVLHVAPLPPPLGGMASYIQGLLQSDLSKKVDMQVVRSDYLGKERFSGILRVVINFLNAILLTCVFLWRILVWCPQIVHIQTNSGFGFYEKIWIALLAKLMGRKTLMHVHGGNFREFYKQSHRLIQKLIYKCADVNDRIVTASPQMRDTWLMIGLPETKITQIDNAVFLPDIELKSIHRECITILFLTRIVVAKGIIELVDAVRILHQKNDNVRLRIVGAEETETDFVKKYLESVGGSEYIQYIGPVTEEQKHDEYINADIFAFPTHVEDQSYAVMEAMSYGLTCVASNVGGVPSLITDGENGILTPPQNVDFLVAALEKVICDQELRTRLGLSARNTIASQFTWDIPARKIYALYNNVLVNSA